MSNEGRYVIFRSLNGDRGLCFQRTKWTDFIRDMDLEQKLIDSGYASPKNFVKERYMDQWIVYQVTKRLEGK